MFSVPKKKKKIVFGCTVETRSARMALCNFWGNGWEIRNVIKIPLERPYEEKNESEKHFSGFFGLTANYPAKIRLQPKVFLLKCIPLTSKKMSQQGTV